MPYTTIKDPGIGKGFAILADALAPNAEREINADLAARRRDQMAASTAIDEQKLAQMREQHANQVMIQSILAGNPDLTDPAVRADFMAAIAGTENGMQYGPRFATGATTYVNPQTFAPDDLSNVLLGTGVVNGYDQTPSGAAANNANELEKQRLADAAAGERNDDSLANALTRQQMVNDAAMQRHVTPGAPGNSNGRGAPLDVSPADTAKLWTLIQERLAASFPDVSPEDMDPAVAQALMPRVAELYQVSRNAETAIAQALGEIAMEQYTNDPWGPLNSEERLRPKASAGAPAAADKPAAAGAPTAAAGPIQEGQTATNPKTGEKIIFKGGQWVPL